MNQTTTTHDITLAANVSSNPPNRYATIAVFQEKMNPEQCVVVDSSIRVVRLMKVSFPSGHSNET